MTGGFPCQPFSVAGKKRGKNDTRHLWPEFFRLIKQAQPTWVLAENVPGIIDMELENVCNDLEGEGYEVQTFIVPASAVGAPHKRDRLWIVANAARQRCDSRPGDRKGRCLQDDFKRHVEALHAQWAQYKPIAWQTFTASSWFRDVTDTASIGCHTRAENSETLPQRPERQTISGTYRNDRNDCDSGAKQSRKPDNIEPSQFNRYANESPFPGVHARLPDIVDRNKALGNSIVPQIAFIFLATIKLIEENYL
jgi:DNA (cytosine-5)-methyltransferase 1